MPSAEQLAFFSKEPSVADELVGRSIWFNWGAVGWPKGEITRRNHNKSYKVDEEYKNFFIFLLRARWGGGEHPAPPL